MANEELEQLREIIQAILKRHETERQISGKAIETRTQDGEMPIEVRQAPGERILKRLDTFESRLRAAIVRINRPLANIQTHIENMNASLDAMSLELDRFRTRR